MKILKIELQNINSLKSDEPLCVDFESEAFHNIGLFAITGSTGAGKTTILDAITIAMYHEVPRFNKSHIKAGLEDVVSRGTDSAMARVTFETNGTRYESSWGIRVADKKGKRLGKPIEQVRLKNLSSGEILAEKKGELIKVIERVTMLNYGQFLRSVMLAQGEFASFLSAAPKDKGELLEQIAGQEIYKLIGEKVSDRQAEEKAKLHELQSKINLQDLLSDETRGELTAQLQHLHGEIEDLGAKCQEYLAAVNWFAREEVLTETGRKLQSQETDCENDRQRFQPELLSLSQHEKAEPFKELIDGLARVEKDIAAKQKQMDELMLRKTALLPQLEQEMAREIESQSFVASHEASLKEWQPKLDEVTTLDTQMTNLAESIKAKQKAIDEIAALLKGLHEKNILNKQQLTNKKTSVQAIDKYLQGEPHIEFVEASLSSWITQLTTRKGLWATVQSLEKKMAADQKSIETCLKETDGVRQKKIAAEQACKALKMELDGFAQFLKEQQIDKVLKDKERLEKMKSDLAIMQQLRGQIATDDLKLAEIVKQKTELAKTIDHTETSLACKAGEILICEQSLVDAEQLYAQELKIKEYEAERAQLEAGKPCALCGSTVHPYVKEYVAVEISEREKELAARKQKLKAVQDELKALEIKKATSRTNLENLGQTIETLQETIETGRKELDSLRTSTGVELENMASSLESIMLDLLNTNTLIEKIQTIQHQREARQKEFDKANASLQDAEIQIGKQEEKLDGMQRTTKADRVEWERATGQLSEIEKALEVELLRCGSSLPEIESTDAFIKALQQRIMNVTAKKSERNDRLTSISLLEKDIENVGVTISTRDAERVSLTVLLGEEVAAGTDLKRRRQELLPDLKMTVAAKRQQLHDDTDKARTRLDEVQKRMSVLQQELVKCDTGMETTSKLIADNQEILKSLMAQCDAVLEQTTFISRADIEQALLPNDTKKKYADIRKRLDDKRLGIKTLREKLDADVAKLLAEKSFEQTREQAAEALQRCEAASKQKQQTVGEIKNRFEQHENILRRNQAIIDQINLQNAVIKRWETLFKLLGGTKASFNTYVQRLTLKSLIARANQHLTRLNRRYSLFMGDTFAPGEELLFELTDHYQTNERRKVETASGGEKFVISLSLALGLSDLASRNVTIGSLFIDEGFGTLDSQTLETVVSTLETLQGQGKLIGIISHVESLKERIPTQILVEKRSNGVSRIV